ncbi:hypothetical protein QZH41_001902 [Actinostola sp. cb2023]|nr:hypothetical protein QZH41_001902 [Actinostola sp. cb2023]
MEGICHDKPLHKEPILQFLEKQNQLTEILAQQHQQSLLPRLHLSKFTNDPLDFNTFMRGFQSQVEARTQSSEVCLQYLEQYLEGEAKDLIKGCLHKNPDLGYREAKDLLKAKYGDPYRVSNGYITKVNDWPILKPGDDSALECLSNFLTQCVSAMESLSYLSILDHPQNLQTLVKKLPIYLQDRWRRQAIRMRKPNECLPKFKHFAEFIDTEAKIATDPIFSREVLRRVGQDDKVKTKPSPQNRSSGSYRVTSHATSATSVSSDNVQVNQRPHHCVLCNGIHDLDECKEFVSKPLAERRSYLLGKGLCYACYETGHRSRGCTQKRQCKVCLGRHPTGLHDYNFRQTSKNDKADSSSIKTNDHKQGDNKESTHSRETNPSNLTSSRIINDEVQTDENASFKKDSEIKSMPIVPVKLRANNEEIIVYAMLDNCSTGTFVSEDTIRKLNVKGTQTKIAIRTMNGTKVLDSNVITGLVVSDIDGNNCIDLPRTFSREEIPASKEEIPRPGMARKWRHLKYVADTMPPYMQGVEVGLLIGTNCPKAIEPKDFVVSKDGGPYAVLTFAGWTVVGPLYVAEGSTTMSSCCNRIVATDICTNKPPKLHYKVDNSVKEIVSPETLNKLLDLEFSEALNIKTNESTHWKTTSFLRRFSKM